MPYDLIEVLPKGILDSPLSMLCFYDEDIQKGALNPTEGVRLDDWQREILAYFGREHNYGDPELKAMLLAANGSGKSQYILAPLAIWMLMRYPESLTIITTASGAQLDQQDLRYCVRLANKINRQHKEFFPAGIIECQYRKLTNKLNESYIDMFATDEPGKAEGKHPLKHDGKFCIIVDEGKTVNDEIYTALERCTGSTHRLDISSAGKSSGQFYVDWNFEGKRPVYKRKITAYDCKHLKPDDIQEKIDKHGLFDPLVRSSIFSEFNSSNQQVVVSREMLMKNITLSNIYYDFGSLRGGLDLAAGGDENSFSIWKGNKEIERHNFRYADTNKTVSKVVGIIESFNGELTPENINADDGGVGRGILDNFRNTKTTMFPAGFNFRRYLNQSVPNDKTRYANRGTELWFTFKRFIEDYLVLFLKDNNNQVDKTLIDQLTNRYYVISDGTGKLRLESKQKAKLNGHPSPDRADAVILAWARLIYPINEILTAKGISANGPVIVKSKNEAFSELAQKMRRNQMAEYHLIRNGGITNKNRMPRSYSNNQLNGRGNRPAYRHEDIFDSKSSKRRF